MKSIKTLIISFLVIVAIFLIVNQLAINSYDGQYENNWNVRKSKDCKLYLGEYVPIKASAKLKFDDTVHLNIAWAEKQWTIRHDLLFFERIDVQPGLNLVIPDITSFLEKDYTFEPFGQSMTNNGGMEKLGQTFSVNELADTITFILTCKKADSWTEIVVTDTVKYFRNF